MRSRNIEHLTALQQARTRQEEATRERENAPWWLHELGSSIWTGLRRGINNIDIQQADAAQQSLDAMEATEGKLREIQQRGAPDLLGQNIGADPFELTSAAGTWNPDELYRKKHTALERARDRNLAEYEEDLPALIPTRAAQTQQEMETYMAQQGLWDSIKYMATHPRMATNMAAESLGQFAPTLLATGVATAAGGPVAGAAVIGAGSAQMEHGSTLAERIDASGAQQHKSRADILADRQLMDDIRHEARTRAAVIGTTEALTFGLTGPAYHAVRARVPGWKGTLAAWGAGTGVQATGGAGGEAAAQLATKGEITSWPAVVAEFYLEILQGAPEIAFHAQTGTRLLRQEHAQDMANLRELGENVQNSTLRQRAPDEFDAVVAEMAETGNMKSGYIDGEVLHQSDLAEALAQALPEQAAEIRDAIDHGGQVQIRGADLVTRILPDEALRDALAPHLRFDADGYSSDELDGTVQAELEAELARRVAEAAGEDARQQEMDTIRDTLAAQLDSIGRFTPAVNKIYGTLVASFYDTTAQKLGISAQELMAQRPLHIVGEPVSGLNQEALPGTYFRRNNRDESYNDDFVMMFADKTDRLDHYGRNLWQISPNSGVRVRADSEEFRAAMREWLEDNETWFREMGYANEPGWMDTLMDLANPDDIVDSAGFWDIADRSIMRYFDEEVMQPNGWDVVETYDGAITFNPDIVERVEEAEDDFDEWLEAQYEEYKAANPQQEDTENKQERAPEPLEEIKGRALEGDTVTHHVYDLDLDKTWAFTNAEDAAAFQQRKGEEFGDASRFSLHPVEKPYVLRKKSAGTLNQNTPTGAPRGAFDPATNTIALLEKADLSTFIHELGHFFFENNIALANQLIARDNAAGGGTLTDGEKQLINDVDALLAQANLDLDTWNIMTLDQRRSHHETVARQFEAYMMEGKAPSPELQGLFARARAWLFQLYKKLTTLNVQLTDDVRQVFDRMLTGEAAINQARQMRLGVEMLLDADIAGMTADEFKQFHQDFQAATNMALDEMQLRMLADAKAIARLKHKALQNKKKEATAARGLMELEARQAINAQPVYRAWQLLSESAKSGKPSMRLDPQALEALGYSADQIKTLGRKVRKSNSVHPDIVAEMILDDQGNPVYDSGDALVQALLAVPDPNTAITQLADQMMLQQYGELATPQAIAEAADLAIHNDITLRLLATEYNALAKATGKPSLVSRAARQLAREVIGRTRVRDINPTKYTRMEAKAARRSFEAAKKGDTALAAAEKRNQLLQAAHAREALEAKVEIKKMINYLRRMNRLDPKKIAIEYREQIEALLDGYSLRQRSGKALDRRQSLADWVQDQRNQGFEPDIPERLLDDLNRKPWQELTVDELRGLADTVKQIEHIGKTKQELLTARKNKNAKKRIAEMAQAVEDNAPWADRDNRTPVTMGGRVRVWTRNFAADHRRVAMQTRQMDGNVDGGVITDTLVRPANVAGDTEAELTAHATEYFNRHLVPAYNRKSTQRRNYTLGGKQISFSDREIFGMMLNWGNEGNRLRLLDGEGWTAAEVEALFAARLTADDARAVQKVWDYYADHTKDKIAEIARRVDGIEPQWVEALAFTFTDASGESVDLQGGYYPIMKDPMRSPTVQAQQEMDMRNGNTGRAAVRDGFTKNRAKRVYGQPLRYDLAGIYQGLGDVIHYIAWREWAVDANRLLGDNEFTRAVMRKYGAEALKQLRSWRDDIISNGNREREGGIQVLSTLRQNIALANLGFSSTTAVAQVLGLFQSMVRVGHADILWSTLRYLGSMREMTDSARAASTLLQNRGRTQFRELNELRNMVGERSKIRQAASKWGFWLLLKVQGAVDIITWHAQYEKSILNGATDEDAVAQADQAVLDSQGSGMLKDLSAAERGGELKKLLTIHYNYMNTVYNLQYNSLTARNNSVAKKIADVLTLSVLMVIADHALRSLLTPGDDDKWDEDQWYKTIGRDVLAFQFGQFVGLRELTGIINGYGYSGPTGTSPFANMAKLAQQAGQGEADDAFFRALVQAGGSLTGLPSAQINRTIKGARALADDETDNPLALAFGYQK